MSESQHQTVLLDEAVTALVTRPDGFYVDGTFGRGGHSRLILERLSPAGRLLGIDKDWAAVAAAEEHDADLARAAMQRHRLRQRHGWRRGLHGVGAFEVIALNCELGFDRRAFLWRLRVGQAAFEHLDGVGNGHELLKIPALEQSSKSAQRFCVRNCVKQRDRA